MAFQIFNVRQVTADQPGRAVPGSIARETDKWLEDQIHGFVLFLIIVPNA